MVKLRDGKPSALGDFEFTIAEGFFRNNSFGITSVNTKTFILLLARQKPLSFLSGAPIDLEAKLKDANRTEFHHLMPRKFLRDRGVSSPSENVIANFAFMSRADNREIGGDPPSEYRKKMEGDVTETLKRSLIPEVLFEDDYERFIADRSLMLLRAAGELCEMDAPDLELTIAARPVAPKAAAASSSAAAPSGGEAAR
jgi:hypothetical protein